MSLRSLIIDLMPDALTDWPRETLPILRVLASRSTAKIVITLTALVVLCGLAMYHCEINQGCLYLGTEPPRIDHSLDDARHDTLRALRLELTNGDNPSALSRQPSVADKITRLGLAL